MTIVVAAGRIEKRRKEAVRLRALVDRHHYFEGVAEARYVLRKVFRIIEEQAKLAGLDPLAHQALIQIYGSPSMQLRVKDVAERLDIVAALASSIVKSLEGMGYVARLRSEHDQRTTLVAVTPQGRKLLHCIDEQVHMHVDYFTRQLSQEARETALSIMMFYIGVSLAAPNGKRA
jgi:DNA-binding MarR family transcriptional regulator